MSFWAKADSNKNIATEFTQNFGTGGSPSTGVISIGVTTHSLTTSWQKFTTTVSIPSISGKTLGTDNNDYLHLVIWFESGSTYSSRNNSLGQQSGTFDIAQVQLEEGSAATPFEQRPIGMELSLCQRYYFAQGHELFFNYGGTTQIHQTCIFPTTMRSAPTITYYATYTDFSNNTNPGYAHKDGVGSVAVSQLSSGINHDIAIISSGQGSNHRLYRRADAEL